MVAALLLFLVGCSIQAAAGRGSLAGDLVILDIGHYVGAEGAVMPSAIDGKRFSETAFWYRYCYDVKREVERAGYRCVVTNRGFAPTSEPLASEARRAGVVHLRRPDRGGQRRPSHYHPDRVGSGIVSADYAIYRRAACVVFLHHNSSSSGWVTGASPSLIICNRYNGRGLAQALASVMDREILDHGMPNGGRKCRVQARYVDADRSAAWMNALDDSGIPAAVLEVAYLNNRGHAAFLVNDANARRYARAVGKGIVNFMSAGGNARPHVRADENKPDEGSFGYAAESRRLNVPGAKRLVH